MTGDDIVPAPTFNATRALTISGGPEEIVTPGVDGELIPPGDAKAIADAVLRLARDPDRRGALAAAAADTVRRRFSLEAQTGRYEALCRELLGMPQASPSSNE